MRFNLASKRAAWGLTAVIAGILFLSFAIGVDPPGFTGSEADESAFWAELNECTTGLVSGSVTPDGRPLLWKNRDVGNTNQEFHYYDDGRIPFISITYSGDTDEYYGGINAAGFALENSNSYNLPAGPGRNGWGASDDDGEIHLLALSTCRTVDDFQRLMDSTNVDGRTLNSNYGAFDALGGAAMFETGGYTYTRIDADDTPDGFIVRANHSYSGTGLNQRPAYWGPNRHDRGYALWKWAADHGELTARYIFQKTIRNLAAEGMDDYELPYRGQYQDWPIGLIPNGECICRSTTRGVLVAQGVRRGENPYNSILWAMAGNQLGSIVTPLWVRAGSVPVEYDSPAGSRICTRAQEIATWIYDTGLYGGTAVNTWKLVNPEGTGYWDWAFPLEDYMFAKVDRFVHSPQFSYDRLRAFQNEMAQQIADSMAAWHPQYISTEVFDLVFLGNNIELRWGEMQGLRGEGGAPIPPRQYAVYRSSEPFRDHNRGERIAEVELPRYLDENPPTNNAFYRVEALFY
ncbi:MAG: hypothetical protein V2A61_05580 [Calditrichota bacterium]